MREFGLSNSGAILSMPISPRLSAFCFDAGVYSLPNASGTSFIELSTVHDVDALNELQFLTASKNIYFRNWDEADRIKLKITSFSEGRSNVGPISRMYIRDQGAKSGVVGLRNSETGETEIYRKGTPEEELTAKETIVTTAFQYPEPLSWPYKLKYRGRVRTFYNGTGVGRVRK